MSAPAERTIGNPRVGRELARLRAASLPFAESSQVEHSTLPSVFVTPEQQEQYLREKGIRVERLANGATILGVARGTNDSLHTEIDTIFTTGEWTDLVTPEGKVELTHFVEHMFYANKKVFDHAFETKSSVNAFTDQRTVSAWVGGIAIPHNEEVGIWSLLKVVRDSLTDPLNFPDVEKYVEIERKRIITELTNYEDEEKLHSSQVYWALAPILFDPESILARPIKAAESIQSVSSITLEDLRAHAARILNPKDMIIDIYTEGSPELLEEIIQEVKRLYSDFPNGDKPKLEFPKDQEKRLNPDFGPGKRYEVDTENGNEMSIYLAWPFQAKQYSPESTALAQISNMLNERTTLLNFEHAWGYSPFIDIIRVNDETVLLSLDLTVPIDTQQFPNFNLQKFVDEELIPVFTTDGIQNGLTEEKLQQHMVTIHALQNALPISAETKSVDTLNGLIFHDAIPNIDTLRQLVHDVTPEQMAIWRDALLATPPAVIMIGNHSLLKKEDKTEVQTEAEQITSPVPAAV